MVGVCDLNDDDDVGTISSRNKMAAAAIIYHLLPMVFFLIKITLFNGWSWNELTYVIDQ